MKKVRAQLQFFESDMGEIPNFGEFGVKSKGAMQRFMMKESDGRVKERVQRILKLFYLSSCFIFVGHDGQLVDNPSTQLSLRVDLIHFPFLSLCFLIHRTRATAFSSASSFLFSFLHHLLMRLISFVIC